MMCKQAIKAWLIYWLEQKERVLLKIEEGKSDKDYWINASRLFMEQVRVIREDAKSKRLLGIMRKN